MEREDKATVTLCVAFLIAQLQDPRCYHMNGSVLHVLILGAEQDPQHFVNYSLYF